MRKISKRVHRNNLIHLSLADPKTNLTRKSGQGLAETLHHVCKVYKEFSIFLMAFFGYVCKMREVKKYESVICLWFICPQ